MELFAVIEAHPAVDRIGNVAAAQPVFDGPRLRVGTVQRRYLTGRNTPVDGLGYRGGDRLALVALGRKHPQRNVGAARLCKELVAEVGELRHDFFG